MKQYRQYHVVRLSICSQFCSIIPIEASSEMVTRKLQVSGPRPKVSPGRIIVDHLRPVIFHSEHSVVGWPVVFIARAVLVPMVGVIGVSIVILPQNSGGVIGRADRGVAVLEGGDILEVRVPTPRVGVDVFGPGVIPVGTVVVVPEIVAVEPASRCRFDVLSSGGVVVSYRQVREGVESPNSLNLRTRRVTHRFRVKRGRQFLRFRAEKHDEVYS